MPFCTNEGPIRSVGRGGGALIGGILGALIKNIV